VRKVPAIRIRDCNGAPVGSAGRYVLYWMITSRRLTYNFALDRALEHAREFRKPLMILEALRCGYPWASDRLHAFVLGGMAENAKLCASRGVAYYPYVEPVAGKGPGLLAALARDACVVVTDEYPCFFLPRMIAAAAKKISVRLEAVDSNGLLPLRAAEQSFATAFAFRRFLQKTLPAHLHEFPSAEPLRTYDLPLAALLKATLQRWPVASAALLAAAPVALAELPIDHHVQPTKVAGGHAAARRNLLNFLKSKHGYY
jgi:deoxyribodipyrimidine photo-lyase